MAVRVQEAASHRLDVIYRYTRNRWGSDQADRYIIGLFAAFEKIETHGVMSKPVPAEFGVEGYFFRYERHFVYWRRLSDGDIGIVTILHERMHQIYRFREDFGLNGPFEKS
ncbi:type II toxin-antitoxin system RelE/ParE family toxin [Bradyrhizobium sp. Leo121]|uniref:type II toxin-antitoxin system RelE/ParE family toxin n=1 Tax=Bradyrhizobium sp. Leo121 TaxID=1571195 RepID=UPI0010289408|nr:type II toxin-antitoxin system RelE/ParE family toxin [Bradyrhizobium sp. Leo121]RZN18161.1 plasmid stabilization protein [Bradyrhizobium sp. Leo121]